MNILVTGASRGIGLEFVEHYLKDPKVKKIWAVTRNPESLKSLIAQNADRLKIVPLSVSDQSSKANLHELLNTESLDLLINNAGMYPKEADDFENIEISSLQQGFEGNAYTTFRTTQACLPALQRSKSPKVVSISSLMGSIGDNTSGGSYAYRMSKAAINMFTKCFAAEFPKISAIAMHPGWVKTDMGGDQAPTSKTESVQGMIRVIDQLENKNSGKFYDFEGDELPW